MTMTRWKNSKYSDSGEWQFAYFVRTADDNGWTTTTRQSAARGTLNMFRLFKTIGEAIRDFANTQQGVDVIDITGSDTYTEKGAQKSRIYIELLRNNPDLAEFNITTDSRGVFLIRKTATAKAADATGVEDADDYWTPDGSETAPDDTTQWRANPDGSQSGRF